MTKYTDTYAVSAKRFVLADMLTKRHADRCATAAMLQFRHHGDASLLTAFAALLEGKLADRTRYVRWVVEHAEVMFYRNTFKKDFEHDMKPEDFSPTDKVRCWVDEGAFSAPFYEWKAPSKLEYFNAEDVLKAIEGVVKRFDNAEKKKASNVEATNIVAEMRRIVAAAGGKLKTGGYNAAA